MVLWIAGLVLLMAWCSVFVLRARLPKARRWNEVEPRHLSLEPESLEPGVLPPPAFTLQTKPPTQAAVTVDREKVKVRALSSEELAGMTANLFHAQGYTLVQQELLPEGAELLLETPAKTDRVRVRCISSSAHPLDGAMVQRVAENTLRQTVVVMPWDVAESARGEAERRKVELVDGPRLLRLLRVYLPGAAEALRLTRGLPELTTKA